MDESNNKSYWVMVFRHWIDLAEMLTRYKWPFIAFSILFSLALAGVTIWKTSVAVHEFPITFLASLVTVVQGFSLFVFITIFAVAYTTSAVVTERLQKAWEDWKRGRGETDFLIPYRRFRLMSFIPALAVFATFAVPVFAVIFVLPDAITAFGPVLERVHFVLMGGR